MNRHTQQGQHGPLFRPLPQTRHNIQEFVPQTDTQQEPLPTLTPLPWLRKHRVSPPPMLKLPPLDETYLDSDDSSGPESLNNSSFSSYTSTDSSSACSSGCSLAPALPRCLSTLLLLRSTIVVTPVAMAPCVTTSKLTELLKTAQAPQPPRLAPNSAGFKSWRVFLAFFVNYAMRPGSGSKEASQSDDKAKELVTFSEVRGEQLEIAAVASRARNREYRINSDFLKRYALDLSARAKGLLPPLDDTPASMRPSKALRDFDTRHGLARYSDMSREKLWGLVVLPPRADPCPRDTIAFDGFLFEGAAPGSSIAAKTSSCVPWAAHIGSIKPAGQLPGAACVRSVTLPTLALSVPQYTIRGWCSDRWASLTPE